MATEVFQVIHRELILVVYDWLCELTPSHTDSVPVRTGGLLMMLHTMMLGGGVQLLQIVLPNTLLYFCSFGAVGGCWYIFRVEKIIQTAFAEPLASSQYLRVASATRKKYRPLVFVYLLLAILSIMGGGIVAYRVRNF